MSRFFLPLLVAIVLTATAATAADQAKRHRIYEIMPHISLSGLMDPDMPDRSDIDKAWPKKPADPKKIRIGWTEINQASDFFVALRDAAERYAKFYGYDIGFLIANDDANAQSQHIDTFITQDVDIIVVDPVNSSAPVRDIERAVAAGIPVITVGTVPEDCPILTTFCTNPFIDGFMAGQYAAKGYAAERDVLATVVIGVMGSSTSESRVTGQLAGIIHDRMAARGKPYAMEEDAWLEGFNLFQTLKQTGRAEHAESGFRILGFGVGSWTIEGGLAAAEDLITANPNMDLLIAENDFMAAGALMALRQAGIEDKVAIIAAADGAIEGLDMIRAGELLCTGLGSPEEEARFAIGFIHAIFEEGKDPNNLRMASPFNVGIITKENVDDYYDPDSKFYKVADFVFPKSIPEVKAELK